jgi:hypothetical protein
MAPRQPLPKISEDDLIDLAGGATVKFAQELVTKGKVRKALWTAPVVEALVDDGTESREARWNLRSITFQRNECGCEVSVGRRKLCVHSVAAYLALAQKEGYLKPEEPAKAVPAAPKPEPAKVGTAEAGRPAAKETSAPAGPRLKSLTLSDKRGTPIEVRFIIPPNIATAAQRDEIICRLEPRPRQGLDDRARHGLLPGDPREPLPRQASGHPPPLPPPPPSAPGDGQRIGDLPHGQRPGRAVGVVRRRLGTRA